MSVSRTFVLVRLLYSSYLQVAIAISPVTQYLVGG
jgi:hypothetical protein